MTLRPTLIIILLMTTMLSHAQERVIGLHGNALLQHKAEVERPERQAALELPFFDDFYPIDIYPDIALWEDDLVYVNSTFPLDPPTIGVATMDGLNAFGNPYSFVSGAHGTADLLTSLPINLDGLTEGDDVFLSFYFQAGGLGEAPEYGVGPVTEWDYLVVEFKDTAGVWDSLWVATTDTATLFEQDFIAVEEAYLHGDFQFRFRAEGDLTGAFDHWHIDYVRLDRNRDEEIEQNIPEMAYQYLPTSLLTPYYAMPYNQYDSTYLADSHSVFIKNNFIQATTDIIDFYTARELVNGSVLANYSGPSRDLGPLVAVEEEYSAFDIPEDLDEDTVVIRVNYNFLVSAEDTTNAVINRNNRIIKDQVFNNFFAYDDGSPERAYLLEVRRNDALFGQVAQRYSASEVDTLRAVKFYFDESQSDLDDVNFALLVWRSIETDSTEEEVLYREEFINVGELLTGDTIDQINGFTFAAIQTDFILDESDFLIVDGDFYIGFEVGFDVDLPIGLDLNTDGSAAFAYNLGQGWTRSGISGSVMMNPVLGPALSDRFVISDAAETLIAPRFNIFPNPSADQVRISSEVESGYLEVYDALGIKVAERKFSYNAYIDVRSMHAGMYFIRITDEETSAYGVSSFIRP